MDRTTVHFSSDGTRCEAWLYLPPEADGPVPVIVMAHGLGAVKAMRLAAYAERFCAAGYACLVFDYRHFGGSEGSPRQLLDVRRQRADWTAAIAFARSRPELDPDRVIVWGTSFGGGHVIATAAADGRLAAAIAQCPFTDGVASGLAVPPRTSARVTVRAVADKLGSLVGRPPRYVSTAGPVGSVALMTAPDAEPGYLALVDDDALAAGFENRVLARAALGILRYRPGRQAKRIACPILFTVCEHDSVAPAKAAKRYARRAPRGELRLYPRGHFDIYTGDDFERVVGDQLAFVRSHVPLELSHA